MEDDKETISVRVPLFGQQTIKFYKMSKYVFNKLRDNEIKRLNDKVIHLGILHEIGDVPKFSRWNHITTMLILIEKLSELHKSSGDISLLQSLDISFKSEVKLLNKSKFSSVEDLLKCWAILYSIGHFVGTFTTEHALLKLIIKQNSVDAFLEELRNQLNNHINEETTIDDLINKSRRILEEEDIFKFFRIFTTLKALNLFNSGKDMDKSVVELAVFNLLDDGYLLKFQNLDQRKKLENIRELFKMVRQVSYLILDGYFSQNFVNVNPHWLILNVDVMFRDEAYQNLMNNLNIFYTKTIYQSPENMYYHHKLVQKLESSVFQNPKYEGKWDKLLKNIVSNNLDDVIQETISSSINSITEQPKHFARIILSELSKPVTIETSLFSDLDGGVIKNVSADHYEIDIYSEPKCMDDILKVCSIVFELYSNTREEDIRTLIKGFESVGEKLVISTLNVLKTTDGEINYKCGKRKLGHSSIVFCQKTKEEIVEYIKKAISDISDRITKGDETELNESVNLIKEITNNEKDEKALYVYIPEIEALSPEKKVIAECDFMLVKYNLATSDVILYVAEIKSSGDFDKNQLERILKYFLLSTSDERAETVTNKIKLFSKSINVGKTWPARHSGFQKLF